MCLNIGGVQSSTEDTDMDQTVYQDSCQPVCVTNFRHSSSTEVQTTSKPQTSTAIVKTTSSSDVDHTERTRSEQNGTTCSRQDNGAVNLDNGSRTPEINNPELNFETNNDGSDVSNLDHDDLMNDASVTTDSSSSSTSSVISRTGSSASSSSSMTAAASTSCKSPETLTTQIASSPKTTCDSDVQHTSATPLRKSTRCRKRSLPNESQTTCPNCGLSIKISDLENHLQVEINKLERLTKHRRNYDPVKKKTTSNSNAQGTDVMDCHARYKQYLSVRTRRERRNKAKKRLKGPGDEETTCPVCNDTIVGTPEELAEHVDLCLQQQEANSEDDLDVEGENNFEEYTWAGQTRIRASSLLDGGLAASGFAVAKQNCEDEDMELDIDGDDCSLFGKPQYTEADLIPCNEAEESEEKERKALRRAVLTAEGSKPPGKLPADRQRWQQDSVTPQTSTKSEENADSQAASSQAEVIESLKAKLKEQEVQLQKIERPKCLICMDWYTKPLTSIQCWHVHCEECWLRTLGTKKLCPQCNTITSPADLRRIYL